MTSIDGLWWSIVVAARALRAIVFVAGHNAGTSGNECIYLDSWVFGIKVGVYFSVDKTRLSWHVDLFPNVDKKLYLDIWNRFWSNSEVPNIWIDGYLDRKVNYGSHPFIKALIIGTTLCHSKLLTPYFQSHYHLFHSPAPFFISSLSPWLQMTIPFH